MLGDSDFEAFRRLDVPQPAIQLAETLGVTKGGASKILRRLESEGLVVRPQARGAPVERARNVHAAALADVFARYPRQPWPDLLEKGALAILAWLDPPAILGAPARAQEGRSVIELARACGYQRTYVNRRIRALARATVVIGKGRGYAWNPLHARLRDFVSLYWAHHNLVDLRARAPDARIVWQCGPEYLAEAPREIQGLERSALTSMADAGLPLSSRAKYAYRAVHDLTDADRVTHAVLVNPASTTSLGYATLYYAKTTPRDFIDVARAYGADVFAHGIVEFLATRGEERAPFMPAWRDFAELARDYGVSV